MEATAKKRPVVLVVDDEPSITENISYALGTEGFGALCCTTGGQALRALAVEEVALVLLDVGLPDANGFDLLREIRRASSVPVILVTARGGEVDRVVGLELGADDYVIKPFSPRELTARVRAVLRRSAGTPAPAALPEGPASLFAVDDARCAIRYHGAALELTRYEFRLLKVLAANPGRVYTREHLLERISDSPEMSLERTIDTHVKTLRQKLRAVRPDEDPIETHRGLGYSLRERP